MVRRSFLLKSDSLPKNLQKIVLKHSSFEIFYTHIGVNKSIQFQNIQNDFFKTTFLKNDIEQKCKISKKEFKKARKKALARILNKEVYEFKFGSLQSCIELYKGLKLCILKVFFHTLDEAQNFVFPKEFGIEKEISTKDNFDSKSLVLYGYECFDVEKCLKIIDKNPNFTLNFPDSIHTFDGLRIFLFYLFKNLQFWFKSTLQTKQKENFYEFFIYMQKISIILRNFYTVFDKNLSKILANQFEMLCKDALQILHKENFNENLLLLLGSKKLQALFGDFDFFIKESSFYKGEQKEKFFKQLVALQLRKKLLMFKRFFSQGSEYQVLEDKIMELKIFLEYFSTFFQCKSLEKLARKYFLHTQTISFSKLSKKKEKLFKLITKASKNLKIYKG